jgi:hypothetical protein
LFTRRLVWRVPINSVYIVHPFPISRMVRVMAIIVASVSVDIYITIIKSNSQKKHIAITIINIMAMETAICFNSLFPHLYYNCE